MLDGVRRHAPVRRFSEISRINGCRGDSTVFVDDVSVIKRFARCADQRGVYSSLFFSEEPIDIARAKAICVRCVARPHCLAAALARQEPCGVWGGEIFVDGGPVEEKRRRGRPPRVPRPPLVVPEVPEIIAVPDVA